MTQIYIPENWTDEHSYWTAFANGNTARGFCMQAFASDFSADFHMHPESRWELPDYAKKSNGSHKHLMFHAYMTLSDRMYQRGIKYYPFGDFFYYEAYQQIKEK